MGSEVAQRPEGEVARQTEVPNQANQIQTQITMEQGDPLFAQKTRPVLRKSMHVSLVTARTPI